MSDLEFNYEELYFIELRGDGDKLPAKGWGGYNQDFDEAEHVYRYDEVRMIPGREWGVVGVEDIDHGSMSLLVFDIDVHKAPEGFDPGRIGIPNDTLVVKSQSGGFHVYFKINGAKRGDYQESDFAMTADPGFDIDIRGELVNHHVVAPKDIPGIGGDYEVVNDAPIKAYFNPSEAAERITLDGEALLEVDRTTGIGDFEFDRPSDAPDDMPTCYHAGLELRKAAPEDHPNTHKVNVLTALCGLGAGYSVEGVVDHFVNDYAPDDGDTNHCDVDKTTYQVKHLARNLDRGNYSPPAESTLRDYGILQPGEGCDADCPIDFHGPQSEPQNLDVVLEYDEEEDVASEAAAVAGQEAETDGGAKVESPSSSGRKVSGFEKMVQEAIALADAEEIQHKTARHRIARAFDRHYNFVYPEQEVRGWRSTLYVYNQEEGVYEPRGEVFVKNKLEIACGDYVTNQVTNEIVGKLERMSIARGDEFKVQPNRLVVGNGILNLHTGELDDWTPVEYHRTKIETNWNPEAGEPDEIDDFFNEIVEPGDVSTLYRLIAHTLYKEYAAEKAAMLVGGGQNGKSVFLNFVEEFLGEWNVSQRALQEFSDSEWAANSLEGKLANIHPDMGDEGVTDMSTFKKLTGRDTMMANVKYEAPITFENYATMMFAANEMPVFSEDNHAIWRRWVYINFPYTFNENDEDAKEPVPKRVLMRRLTQERELEALLVRCQKEIETWYNGRDWYPDAMNAEGVREQMKKAAEPVYDFAMTCLQKADGEDDYLPKDEVRKCYREYATQEGLPKMSENQFGERLVNIPDLSIENGRRTKSGAGYTYEGVTWTARGRQVLGIDEPGEGDGQTTVDDVDDTRKDIMDITKELVDANDNMPVDELMVIGRAMGRMTKPKAEQRIEDLKERGELYVPETGKVLPTS